MTTKTTTPKKTSPTTKTEPLPKPREQRLVIGNVAEFGKMEWVFARGSDADTIEVLDDCECLCCYYTVEQAEALMDWLQDVVPLMRSTPDDPTAPLVRYVP